MPWRSCPCRQVWGCDGCPPCPTTLCVWRRPSLPCLTYHPLSPPPPPRLPSRDPDSLIRWRAPDLSRFPHSHASWMEAPLYSLCGRHSLARGFAKLLPALARPPFPLPLIIVHQDLFYARVARRKCRVTPNPAPISIPARQEPRQRLRASRRRGVVVALQHPAIWASPASCFRGPAAIPHRPRRRGNAT